MRHGSSIGNMARLPSFMRSMSVLTTARARPISVPQEFLVRDLKEKRKFRLLSRKLTMFVTFVAIYVTVLLMDRNISGRSFVRRVISTELLQTSRAPSGITFNAIDSIGAFWDWFANSFLTLVYTPTTSDGRPRHPDELYTIASHTKIVGGFHLIQTRYAALNTSDASTKGEPCYSTLKATEDDVCFSAAHDSQLAFGQSNGTNASAAILAKLPMFKYSTNESIGGYQTYFLRSTSNGDDEQRLVDQMQMYRWIDRQTKQVEIDMPLYNPNLKLWSIVHLEVLFDLAGGVTPSSSILVTNLEPYDLTNRRNVVRGILEIIFLAHVIYYVLLEFWDICVLSNGSWREYMARYGVINNLGDWANIIINLSICIWRYLCQHNTARQNLLEITSFDEYVPARSLAVWDEVLLALNICNMLLLTARALKYFQVTKGGRRLMYSVYGAMPEVLSFLPIYCSVIIGYTFAGHLLYGLSFPEWATFPRALFRVFELNFGLYDPGAIYDAGGYLSAIFIYSSNVVFCILMLNVFMAIVMSTWEQLSEKEAEKAQERASYTRPLGMWETLQLVIMKESIVDMLIDTAIGLEGVDGVTKHAFTKEWTALGIEVSPATWDRICCWYWDPAASETDVTSIKDKDEGGSKAGGAAPVSTAAPSETVEDALEDMESLDLQLQRKSSITQSKPPIKKRSASAKVAAAPPSETSEQ